MSLKLTLNGHAHTLSVTKLRPHLQLDVDGRAHEVQSMPAAGVASGVAVIDGRHVSFARAGERGVVWVRFNGRTHTIRIDDPFMAGEAARGGDIIRAPMPGAVVEIHRNAGEYVLRGDPVLTIESMKLQTTLGAPRDGVIADMLAGAGQTFEKDEALVRLAPVAGDE